jgi:hypothetical protein
MMNRLVKFVGAWTLAALGLLLLALSGQSSGVTATRADPQAIAPVFGDEFDGEELDLSRWDVYKGTPTVSNGWLTLPGGNTGADIQSEPSFSCGILQGVIQSSDWKLTNGSTDSSFGLEIWEGADGKCHHGVVFKANGHLGLLRSKPNAENKCAGQSAGIPGRHPDDPYYQDYFVIQSWDAIRATGTITFTLTWSKSVTLEVNGGQSSGQVYTDTSPAIPTVPLKIRLYAQPTETYKIDYIRLYPCHAAYLPVVMRD